MVSSDLLYFMSQKMLAMSSCAKLSWNLV